jgi:hypothetical protein
MTAITALWVILLSSVITACVTQPENNEPNTPDDALAFGVATAALTCADIRSVEHAASGNVARERIIRRTACNDGAIHFSIQLWDTRCDCSAARVHWMLRDMSGLLHSGHSGTAVHGDGCDATSVTVTLPTQTTPSTYVVNTTLQACNSTGCSAPRSFEDRF